MSVRAYKILEIKRAEDPTFNLWHDQKLVDFLEKYYAIYTSLNENGGIIDLPVEVLEKAIKELRLEEDVRQALQKDIDWATQEKSDYIQYLCF